MKIIQLALGSLETNCYIVYCPTTLAAAVIDPGAEAGRILKEIAKNKLKLEKIILTHGHGDHIGALNEVREASGAAVLIHAEDAMMLTNANKNLSVFIGPGIVSQKADRLLADGDLIEIGELKLKVLHTPGHTKGGICLYAPDTLFAGDTLFAQSIGRTDFPGGSFEEIVKSIKEKLFTLPPETTVLPGHGPETSIAVEIKTNPFVK
ncbi:MAG: MBL fold metallo-hydrolase [Sporomusaceae bacterium]|jgi:glyoxylase-like metal-dependent hydrolase (beta-lactamase superfamily II)|nr:MBL fold metallo-hydrolase [Sporomusaceae bacterium]